MKSLGRVFILLLLVALLLMGCDGVGNSPPAPTQTAIVVTATALPATVTPAVTVTPMLPAGDFNVCGQQFPSGYQWVAGADRFPNINYSDPDAPVGSISSFPFYANSDGRRQYYYTGSFVTPYNYYNRSQEVAIPFPPVTLQNTPAWINVNDYPYCGSVRDGYQIEVTQINGRVGVEYGQTFQTGACYDFKLYIRSNITQNFNPENVDIRMEIHTTDAQITYFEEAQSVVETDVTTAQGVPIEPEVTAEPQLLLNVHSIPNPFASYEFTWRGYHNGAESGQVLMYAEIRFANMHGSLFVFSAGTLRAPQWSCFDENGNLADGVYGF